MTLILERVQFPTGEVRDALRCYGPSQYTVDAEGEITIKAGAIGHQRMLAVVPPHTTATELGWLASRLIAAPAISFGGKNRFHPNITAVGIPLLLAVHEWVHVPAQYRRMGRLDFDGTYGYQGLLEAARGNGFHIHRDHEMEREARRISEAICAALTSEQELVPFDAWPLILAAFQGNVP